MSMTMKEFDTKLSALADSSAKVVRSWRQAGFTFDVIQLKDGTMYVRANGGLNIGTCVNSQNSAERVAWNFLTEKGYKP